MSKKINKFHPFHIVDPSPWPLLASFSAFFMLVGAVMYMHSYQGGLTLFFSGLILLTYTFGVWWRDVIREGTFFGFHTKAVQTGLRYGVILFILSEVMLFFAIFWAFFHSALAPTVEIGGVWPPVGIDVISPWEVPFLNTMLLLTSGASVTWAHHALVVGNKDQALKALIVTVVLAVIFTGFQAYEYIEAPFSIADGIYGSTFFLSTGFHGFHVIIGTIFLAICAVRVYLNHFSSGHHFGFEAAAWYWHMVDVVWLFLFICVYYWGGV